MNRNFVFDLIEQYYSPSSRAYEVLVRHGEDVATLALEIAEAHPELGADRQFLWEAAMLHDIGICRTHAPDIDCYGEVEYIYHGYLGANILRTHDLGRHACVAERHTGAGLTAEDLQRQGIDLPKGIYEPISLEERIVCYADKFYSKTHLGQRKSLGKVRSKMARHGEAALERFERLHAELGIGGED